MPFGLWAREDSRNRVLGGVQIAKSEGAFLGKLTCPGMPDDTAVSFAKMAEPI